MKFKKHILKCRFCQKITGEYLYPSELKVEDLGIADTRCDQHQIDFGSYKKMADSFKGSQEDFIKIMEKSEYKEVNFNEEIKKLNK